MWELSYRADPFACDIADRHYSRQSIGSDQFVPPGRCFVLKRLTKSGGKAAWATSWPFAEYVKHDWAGAWMNTFFRNEGAAPSHKLILAAIAATRAHWPDIPALGMVTFVDPKKVRPTIRDGVEMFGACYERAGFHHVGYTKGGLWAWQMMPEEMPEPKAALNRQIGLFEGIAA